MRWPPGWPLTGIPTVQKYIEALLLHWVRYKDTDRELCWFFKLYDICASHHGYNVWNRMERHCRHIMESLLDFLDFDNDNRYHTGVMKRDILLQAEKLLWKRAAGPLRHDPHMMIYGNARLMPPRFPTGKPYGWNTENHSWRQEEILYPGDRAGSSSAAEVEPCSSDMVGST